MRSFPSARDSLMAPGSCVRSLEKPWRGPLPSGWKIVRHDALFALPRPVSPACAPSPNLLSRIHSACWLLCTVISCNGVALNAEWSERLCGTWRARVTHSDCRSPRSRSGLKRSFHTASQAEQALTILPAPLVERLCATNSCRETAVTLSSRRSFESAMCCPDLQEDPAYGCRLCDSSCLLAEYCRKRTGGNRRIVPLSDSLKIGELSISPRLPISGVVRVQGCDSAPRRGERGVCLRESALFPVRSLVCVSSKEERADGCHREAGT
jgi:hypothetical protein